MTKIEKLYYDLEYLKANMKRLVADLDEPNSQILELRLKINELKRKIDIEKSLLSEVLNGRQGEFNVR